MAQIQGKRNLALIRKSGSTARILNLLVAHERFGATEAYQKNPFFRTTPTNKAIVIKHTLRGSESDLFERPSATGTKVIYPFAVSDLNLGGAYFFVGQRNAIDIFRDYMGDGVSDSDLQYDFDTLTAVDQLPSLDPFLLREGLKRSGRAPALCYLDISEADIARMRDYVSGQIARLIELAFGGGGGAMKTLASQMAEKLLSDENTEQMAPLKVTLQLSGPEYTEGIFAWKGFLYYKWQFVDSQLELARTKREVSRLRVISPDRMALSQIEGSKERIVQQMSAYQAAVVEALTIYDTAFGDLTERQNPAAFREFLLNSPQMFEEIGMKLGALRHVSSYWKYRSSQPDFQRIFPEDALDILLDFENSLSTGGAASRSQVKW